MFTAAVARRHYCCCNTIIINTISGHCSFSIRPIGYRESNRQLSSTTNLFFRSLHSRNISLKGGSASPGHLKSRGQNLRLSRSSPFNPTSAPATNFVSSTSYHCQRRGFCISQVKMTAVKIDGTAIAKNIREKLHAQIEETQKTNPRFRPSLKIIQGITPIYLYVLSY